MFVSDYDPTPFYEFVVTAPRREFDGTPVSIDRRADSLSTAFSDDSYARLSPRSDQTGVLNSDLLIDADDSESPGNLQEATQAVITKARDDRLALLALRFEGKETVENAARFHLLTNRLRRLQPRVSAEERQALAGIVTQLEDGAALMSRIKAEFNI